MKIYLVSKGEYSDYRILGAYSTQENAETAADLFGGEVEEYEIDQYIEQIRAGLKMYQVSMKFNGDTWFVYELEQNQEEEHRLGWSFVGESYREIEITLYASVWANSKEHAAKIVNEHRARMIASGEWSKAENEIPLPKYEDRTLKVIKHFPVDE